MKAIIFYAVIGAIATGYFLMHATPTTTPTEDMYNAYLAEYRKSYNTADEYQMRLSIFKNNLQVIEEHNAKGLSWTLGLNQFTDWTSEEFQKVLGYRKPAIKDVATSPTTGKYPASVDWRDEGAIGKVVNQGQCGSCWAFGTIGTLEGALELKTGKFTKLSEQQLVDCCHDKCYGCSGGFQYAAIDFYKTHKACLESEYEYTARDGSCKEDSCTNALDLTHLTRMHIDDYDKEASLEGLSHAPASITVAVDSSFQMYSSGVFRPSRKYTSLNHAVLGAGYSTKGDAADQYMLIRNSWGQSWGESGYIRVGLDASYK